MYNLEYFPLNLCEKNLNMIKLVRTNKSYYLLSDLVFFLDHLGTKPAQLASLINAGILLAQAGL